MPLTKLTSTTFVNFNSLAFVHFRDMDVEPKAVLHFVGGGSEALSGDMVASLFEKLNTFASVGDNGEQSSPPSTSDDDQLSVNDWNDSLPSIHRKKAWFYKGDKSSGRAFFMAFINAKGSCSVRTFDAETGIAFPKRYRAGSYQDEFKDLLNGAIEVTVAAQPNLERDCKERLPRETLDYLRKQIA